MEVDHIIPILHRLACLDDMGIVWDFPKSP